MRSLIQQLVLAVATVMPAHASADFYLVVQANNEQHALSQKEAVDLFMGRNRAFANGEIAQVFDLSRSDPKRDAFYHALTGLSQAQVNSYWSRLMFSGRNLPPQPLSDEAAMVEAVTHHPNAIGWLSKEPTDKRVRTLLVLKDLP
jgi:hypothetical protein